MNKRLLYGLILTGVTVLVLIFNRASVDVNLIVTSLRNAPAALVFLVFAVVGVVIGVLLK